MATDTFFHRTILSTRARLATGASVVWWVDLADVLRAPHAPDTALLDAGERERAARFVREGDRRAFIAAHVLARAMLTAALGGPAAAWRFVEGEKGKPALDPGHASGAEFNLSHTATGVACAVSLIHRVGVDIENRWREGQYLGLAEAYFAPAEVAALRAAPAGSQQRLFFATWTLKEAYIKARGMGLSLPLDQFAIALDPPRISFEAALEDDPGAWTLAHLEPDDRHTIAVAVASGSAPATITLDRFPLGDVAALARVAASWTDTVPIA